MAITEQQAWDMSIQELQQAVSAGEGIVAASEKAPELEQLEKSFADFRAAAPDFQYSPENVNALMNHIAWTRMPTVDDLTQAHALASYRNLYKAPEAKSETDPHKMSLEQLHEAAFGGEQRSSEWAMPLADLKKEAGI